MEEEDSVYQSNPDECVDIPYTSKPKTIEHNFLDLFPDDTTNGLCFNDIYVPEEVVTLILSYVRPKEILKTSLVCRKWFNISRSHLLWFLLYERRFSKKPKVLPWYVYYTLFNTKYFDQNLIMNGNGQKRFKHWTILRNYGHKMKVEKVPIGCDPLPLDVPEFQKHTSCFVTSFGEGEKYQEVSFVNNKLFRYVMQKYKPHIYLSEWVAARFDCGGYYILGGQLYGEDFTKAESLPSIYNIEYAYEDFTDEDDYQPPLFRRCNEISLNSGDVKWIKVELVLSDYPEGVARIIFIHKAKDRKFWAGHYGPKMAGGVLKILFDSIEEEK